MGTVGEAGDVGVAVGKSGTVVLVGTTVIIDMGVLMVGIASLSLPGDACCHSTGVTYGTKFTGPQQCFLKKKNN